MNIDTKKLETIVQHHVDVSVALATAQVTEVTAKKYAEITGISYEKVVRWCRGGALVARKLNVDCVEVDTGGSWFVTVSKPILARTSL